MAEPRWIPIWSISKGDLSLLALVGRQLLVSTACVTASAQKDLGRVDPMIMVQAILLIV
jgi:hypothetical protein